MSDVCKNVTEISIQGAEGLALLHEPTYLREPENLPSFGKTASSLMWTEFYKRLPEKSIHLHDLTRCPYFFSLPNNADAF